jgi:acetylglutamate kinase
MSSNTTSELLYIIKIGGNIVDNPVLLTQCLKAFSGIKGKAILVHGGGKLATQLAKDLNIPQEMVEGRRITDAETLKIVTMVYAGLINKNIVAQLQSFGVQAMGLTGADANLIKAHKRVHTSIDYGFVGDVDEVNVSMIHNLLQQNTSIVIAPITHDGNGQLLNTNADTIAQSIATAMSAKYAVHLIYGFEKEGVLLDVNNPSSVIQHINKEKYLNLKEQKLIFEGMVPKMDNAFLALDKGVQSVMIGMAEKMNELINGTAGTTITQS